MSHGASDLLTLVSLAGHVPGQRHQLQRLSRQSRDEEKLSRQSRDERGTEHAHGFAQRTEERDHLGTRSDYGRHGISGSADRPALDAYLRAHRASPDSSQGP